MKISKQDIKENFTYSYYHRGLAYFITKKILSCSIKKETDKFVYIESEVNGSLEYTQYITI